jgi:hypothetical protein
VVELPVQPRPRGPPPGSAHARCRHTVVGICGDECGVVACHDGTVLEGKTVIGPMGSIDHQIWAACPRLRHDLLVGRLPINTCCLDHPDLPVVEGDLGGDGFAS